MSTYTINVIICIILAFVSAVVGADFEPYFAAALIILSIGQAVDDVKNNSLK